MPIAVGVGLEENGARRMFRDICGNGKGGGEVREVKDRFREEEAFEGFEGGLARRGPVPGEVLLGEVEERAGDIGIIGNESSVEIGEAKERANVFHLGRGWPTCNPVKFDRVHGQLTGFNNHAKVLDLVSGELAFFELQMKVKFGHALENAFCAFLVEGSVGGVDEKIIHVDNEPSFSNHIAEGVVHEPLEGCGGVGESEEHHGRFEESLMGDEGGFPLVSVFDSYIVISPPNIEFGEDLSVSQFIYEVRDERKGVGVADGVFIDVAVVLARAESSILLFDEEERRGLGGVGRADLPRGEVFVQKVFSGFAFIWGEGINFPDLRGKGVIKIDFMIIGS